MSRVLLVDLRADTLRVADVAADDGAVRLVAEQRTPRSADLSADLRAAVRGLGSSRTPRRAVCLSDAVTAVCLDLPPAAGLAPDRVEGLVRWELEPFLDLEPGAPVSVGWAAADGAPGAPTFASGIPTARRTDLSEAFTRAGLRLSTLYPASGCAAAATPASGATLQVVEVEPERIAVSRLAGGRVTRFRVVPRVAGDDAVQLLEALREEDAEQVTPESTPLPPSLHGAARHALGLEGGERLPAIAAREALAPVWQRAGAQAVVVLAILLLALAGVEVALGSRLNAARADAAAAKRALATVERARTRQDQLKQQQTTLRARAETVQREERVLAACSQRQAYLPALLKAIAAALPPGVALDVVREETDSSLWIEGFALSDLDTKTFLRDLTQRLAPLALVAREPVVRRRKGRFGAEGYEFVLRFRQREEQ